MVDALKIGLSALLAQQRAIAVASNNVANASTPGYSRQRLELVERPSQQVASGAIGSGVSAATVRRIGDDVVATQLRAAAAGYQRSEAFVGFAESLDNLLADQQTGLNVTLQSFSNAIQDVANDPSSTAARQVLLSEARNLVSRFDTMDRRLNEIGGEVRARLDSTTTEINSLGAGIAEVNRQIVASGVGPDRPPPSDLLDQRDRLLERLSQLVKVDTAVQNDGTLSVFIGSGQTLVLGTSSTQLSVQPGNFDPAQPQVVLSGNGPSVDITPFLTGGELGGTLDFNREMLAPARAELGRIAASLVDTVNAAHRNGMDLNGALGGDLFSIPAPVTFAARTNAGTGTVTATITDVTALEPSAYELTYDGANYTLIRSNDGAVVPTTGTGTAADPFLADGLSLVVSGAPAAGDRFRIEPVEPGTGKHRLAHHRSQ